MIQSAIQFSIQMFQVVSKVLSQGSCLFSLSAHTSFYSLSMDWQTVQVAGLGIFWKLWPCLPIVHSIIGLECIHTKEHSGNQCSQRSTPIVLNFVELLFLLLFWVMQSYFKNSSLCAPPLSLSACCRAWKAWCTFCSSAQFSTYCCTLRTLWPWCSTRLHFTGQVHSTRLATGVSPCKACQALCTQPPELHLAAAHTLQGLLQLPPVEHARLPVHNHRKVALHGHTHRPCDFSHPLETCNLWLHRWLHVTPEVSLINLLSTGFFQLYRSFSLLWTFLLQPWLPRYHGTKQFLSQFCLPLIVISEMIEMILDSTSIKFILHSHQKWFWILNTITQCE